MLSFSPAPGGVLPTRKMSFWFCKTTFLKLLTNQLTPDAGTIKRARDLQISYFDQNRSDLEPQWSLWRNLIPNGGDYIDVMGKPMYADYTRSGRVISFFMRIILVVVKSFVLLLWTIVLVIAMIAWVAGPILAGCLFIRHLIPV